MRIIDALPIREEKFQIDVAGFGPVDILPFQIALLVNLVVGGKATKMFPAILDTGFNCNFGISEKNLRDWLGIDPVRLALRGRFTHGGILRDEKAADVEIRRNVRGTNTPSARSPYRIQLKEGISILDDKVRMPLLGIRALAVHGISMSLRGNSVTLSKGPEWFSWFTW